MRVFSWLKAIRKSERGNVLVIGAAAMPLLIGSAALAIDSVQLTLWKRQLQRAADSGAIAGAYALAQGATQGTAVENDLDEHVDLDLQENETPVISDINVLNGSFGSGTLSTTQNCTARGLAFPDCFERSVQVTLTSQRTLPLISTLRGLLFQEMTPTTIRTRGTAALISDGKYCLISLYDGTDPGIEMNGNTDVVLGCGMSTNSTADDSVQTGNNTTVEVTDIGSAGGIDGESNNFDEDTDLHPYSAPVQDPLARVPTPPSQADNPDCPAGPLPVLTGAPPSGVSCWSGIDWQTAVPGTVSNSTVYVYDGNVRINSHASITMEESVIIMTGVDGDAGDFDMQGGILNLSGPTTGDHRGVAFYRDRRAPVEEMKLNGNATFNVTGAVYMPTTNLTTLGTFDLNAACLQIVGRILRFGGGANLTNVCPGNFEDGFGVTVVRLVG